MTRPTLRERFDAKHTPVPHAGCWLWLAALGTKGYGMFRTPKGVMRAHCFSYELHRGDIPEGLLLDHKCRTRSCVNPWHLEPVTSRENTLRGDGPSARNARKTHCPRGHAYNAENTIFTSDRRRRCRICRRLARERSKVTAQ